MRNYAIAAAAVALCAIVGWLVTLGVGPDPPTLASASNGDIELTTEVESLLDGDTRGLGDLIVLEVEDGLRFAGFGIQTDGQPVTPTTAFEIGSLTKPLTGMLLASLIESGDVTPDTTLAQLTGDQVPLEGAGARARAEDLASHRAGYPRLPTSSLPRALLSRFTGGDPYTENPQSVLKAAADGGNSTGDYAYSNLGLAALGDGLAAQQGTTFEELLGARILRPLSMDGVVLVADQDDIPQARTAGQTSGGRDTDPWIATGWQPAGIGVWATAGDMARLITGILDGSAPGMAAVEPRFPATDDRRIGYGWSTESIDGTDIARHSGGTGGFRSWVGIDRDGGRGVAVLSNTTRAIDDLGRGVLLGQDELEARSPGALLWGIAVFGILAGGFALYPVIRALTRGRGDRLGIASGIINAVTALAMTRVVGQWDLIPVAAWGIGATILVLAVLGAIFAWEKVPVTTGRRPRLSWALMALNTIVAAVIVIVLL